MRLVSSVTVIILGLVVSGCGSDRVEPTPMAHATPTAVAAAPSLDLSMYTHKKLFYAEHNDHVYLLVATDRIHLSGTISDMQKQADEPEKPGSTQQLSLPDSEYTLDADVDQFTAVVIRGKSIKKEPADASDATLSVE